MPSTYSPDLRIELIANGEQSGYWGTTTNVNLGTLIEEAITTTATVTLTSTKLWLTATNGAADEARCAAAVVSVNGTITADFTAYIPPAPKLYVIKNNSAYVMTLRNATAVNSSTSAGGATVVIPAGKTVIVRSDGTNCYSQFDYVPNALQISGALTVDSATTLSHDVTLGNRLSGTYTQTATTVTVTASSHGYVNGESVAFINASGLGQSGTYTITYINANSFSFTSAVSQATSGSCFVSNDFIAANGVFNPGVVIEGSSTIPTLRITQTGAGNAILVEDSTGPDNTPFVVNASGNVGIGTQTPTQLLDITSDGTAITQLSRYSTDTTSAASFIRKSRGTLASPTIVSSGDTAGFIAFQAYDGAAFQSVAQISSAVDGTPGAGDTPGRLVISTTPDGSATLVERVRVDNAGNVIIGSGEASATTTGNTLRAPNRTGTDVAGTNLTIQAGNGTGTGGSGYIALQTAVPGTTGSTADTMVDRLKLSNGVMVGKAFNMDYGVLPVEQFYALASDYAGTNVNTAQALFGVGVDLAANTTYAFEMVFTLFKTVGTTSHTVSLLHNIGSGTISAINYTVLGNFNANPTTAIAAPDTMQYIQTAGATIVTAATTTAGFNLRTVVSGILTIGTAGKWTPQYQLSAAPGGAYSTLAGGYVRIYPIGASGANVNTGGWA
jgi:hypothetical protein